MRKEGVVWKIFNALVIVMGLLLILGPVWVIFINSMKTMQEAGQDFFALPSRWLPNSSHDYMSAQWRDLPSDDA